MPMAILIAFCLSVDMGNSTSLVSKIGHLLVSATIVTVAGAGIATAASGALFTDTETATMEVSSGWVDVAVGGSTVVGMSNLKPGDVFFRSLNVANTGSLGFSYLLSALPVNGAGASLVDALQVETWKTSTAEACASSTYTEGVLIGAEGSLSQLTLPVRQLTPGNSETLCLRISLPTTTSLSAAGKNSKVTLSVASEQM